MTISAVAGIDAYNPFFHFRFPPAIYSGEIFASNFIENSVRYQQGNVSVTSLKMKRITKDFGGPLATGCGLRNCCGQASRSLLIGRLFKLQIHPMHEQPCNSITQKTPCDDIGGIMKPQVDSSPCDKASKNEKGDSISGKPVS